MGRNDIWFLWSLKTFMSPTEELGKFTNSVTVIAWFLFLVAQNNFPLLVMQNNYLDAPNTASYKVLQLGCSYHFIELTQISFIVHAHNCISFAEDGKEDDIGQGGPTCQWFWVEACEGKIKGKWLSQQWQLVKFNSDERCSLIVGEGMGGCTPKKYLGGRGRPKV